MCKVLPTFVNTWVCHQTVVAKVQRASIHIWYNAASQKIALCIVGLKMELLSQVAEHLALKGSTSMFWK